MAEFLLSRRALLKSASAFAATQFLGCGVNENDGYASNQRFSTVDAQIENALESGDTPGIAACVVTGRRIEWSEAYGWADIAGNKRMTVDTIQNIGSVSKTITATAVMQLWEEGKFDLDEDVGNYLPFPVRNPRFPHVPITIRQLLTHTSSITDGPAYVPSYACGDPTISLLDWLQAYLDPSGRYYDAEKNFLQWKPGTLPPPSDPDPYSNLAYGLLGGLIDSIGDLRFAEHCRERIFSPLSMNDTGWFLSDIDTSRHAVPYRAVPETRLQTSSDNANTSASSKYYEHCLYSFANYPDGLVRTSVNDLSKFLQAYIESGLSGSEQILKASTIRTMLTESYRGQGLCWYKPEHRVEDPTVWGHSGGDPGVSTMMAFSRQHQTGVIVLSNFDGWELVSEVSERLLRAAIAG